MLRIPGNRSQRVRPVQAAQQTVWNKPKLGPAMANGRCRMHGGASTGPRTAEGLARSRRARWKHGLYSAEAQAEQKLTRELLQQSRELLNC